jgi:sugar lactone lactonase YvrE
MSTEPRIVVASGNQIGESPVWGVAEGSLYWVDVEGGSIQRCQANDLSLLENGRGHRLYRAAQ